MINGLQVHQTTLQIFAMRLNHNMQTFVKQWMLKHVHCSFGSNFQIIQQHASCFQFTLTTAAWYVCRDMHVSCCVIMLLRNHRHVCEKKGRIKVLRVSFPPKFRSIAIEYKTRRPTCHMSLFNSINIAYLFTFLSNLSGLIFENFLLSSFFENIF